MDTIQTLHAIRSVIEKRPNDFEAYQDYFDMLRILEDKKESYSHNLWLRKQTANMVRNGLDCNVPKFYDLNKKTYLYMARDDFHSFCVYMEWNRPKDKRFYTPRMHTLIPMKEALQEVADNKLDLLIVNQPKRTGKTSFGGNFFGAFMAGRSPEGSSLFTGAKGGLAEQFMKGFWELLNPQGEYLFYDIFPEAKFIEKSEKSNDIHLARKKKFATIQCRGIHGDITGTTEASHGGILYMDDMVENEEEAVNPARLEKRYNEITGDILGRRLEHTPIIIQGTNYSVYDPQTCLMNKGEELGWRMKIVKVPALDFETDESNFEFEQAGIKYFTTGYYRNERQLLGEDSIQWMAQFQQQPFDEKGRLYSRDKLRRYFELPTDEADAVISICDPKELGTDYAFLPVAYVYGQDYYIDDCICDNGALEVIDEKMVDLLIKHKVKMCQYESNSAGFRTAEKIQNGVKSKGGITHITTRRTTSNKETKIIVNAPWIKEHCLFRDDSKIERGSDYWKMLNFLCSWAMGGKNKHDDVPDGLAMLAIFAQNINGSRVELAQRPW